MSLQNPIEPEETGNGHESPDSNENNAQYLNRYRELTGKFRFISDIPLELEVQLGQSSLSLRQLLGLNIGSIVAIKKSAGEPMDIILNKQFLGKGEISVVEDSFNVRIVRIADSSNENQKT